MRLESTRDAYGNTLLEIGNNTNIVVLDADLSVSTQTNKFAKKYPERFFNVGCAEQNLVGVAAGLAISGKIPFVSTYAIFLCRAWEQIRSTIAYDNLNVKMVVSHAGLTNAPDGASHQSLEDIALMRVIPNMTVIVPADAVEAEKAIIAEVYQAGPAYVRLNRVKTPIIFDNDYEFRYDKSVELMYGSDLTIIATGTMVHKALDAAKILAKENISVCVHNLHTIKPIDKKSIIKEAKRTGKILTVEEHSIYGGLGSAIAEVLVENYPVPMKIIGVNDKFGESGKYNELIKKYCLTEMNIVKLVKEMVHTKR